MYRLTPILCFIVAAGYFTLAFPEGFVSIFISGILALGVCVFIRRNFETDSQFLIHVFLLALLARLALGLIIYTYELYDFFGPDAKGYDMGASYLSHIWSGDSYSIDPTLARLIREGAVGYGMHHFSALIYLIAGPSILHVQSVSAVFGAATVPAVFYCASQIYSNRRVARLAAIGVAFFPSFIIWSAQMLKDGIIVFLIVLAICMVYSLQKKLSYLAAATLVFALMGIVSLRFYIFYMVAVACAGSFIVGISKSTVSIARRLIVLFVIAIGVAYSGVWQSASADFAKFGTFERLRVSRQYAAEAASSGFDAGKEVDVSTTFGVLSVVPLGMVYLFLAPFPWQVVNFRQAATLPETFLWWSLIPFGIWGIWFTIKHKLRAAIPVLIFTVLLTLSYSVYQGNVGTAYRQRTQIQVFLFIFIAVGGALYIERREDKKLLMLSRHRFGPARPLSTGG